MMMIMIYHDDVILLGCDVLAGHALQLKHHWSTNLTQQAASNLQVTLMGFISLVIEFASSLVCFGESFAGYSTHSWS